jgi:hypothetical protein
MQNQHVDSMLLCAHSLASATSCGGMHCKLAGWDMTYLRLHVQGVFLSLLLLRLLLLQYKACWRP